MGHLTICLGQDSTKTAQGFFITATRIINLRQIALAILYGTGYLMSVVSTWGKLDVSERGKLDASLRKFLRDCPSRSGF
jgi:hypothetical protein